MAQMKYLIQLLLFSCILSFFACEKNNVQAQLDHSTQYIPFVQGQYWIYQMDSGYYIGTGLPVDSHNYQVRHKIVDLIQDGEGNEAIRLEVSSRANSTAAWVYRRSYQISRDQDQFIRTDFNLKEVVLSIPVYQGNFWDGNAYNSRDESIFYLSSVHYIDSVSSMSFDSTLIVEQEEQDNLVNRILGYEKYAKNVGLIERKKVQLEGLSNPSTMVGYQYTMRLLEYGY